MVKPVASVSVEGCFVETACALNSSGPKIPLGNAFSPYEPKKASQSSELMTEASASNFTLMLLRVAVRILPPSCKRKTISP